MHVLGNYITTDLLATVSNAGWQQLIGVTGSAVKQLYVTDRVSQHA